MTTIFHIICLLLKFSSTFTIDYSLESETANTTDDKRIRTEPTHKAAKISFEHLIADVSPNYIADKASYSVINSIKNSSEHGNTNLSNRINVTHSISENYVTELNQNYFTNSTSMSMGDGTSFDSLGYLPKYFTRNTNNLHDRTVDSLEIVSKSDYSRNEDFPFNLTEIENEFENSTKSTLVSNEQSNTSNETVAPADLFNGDDRKTLINDDDKFDSQNITENEREEQRYACADCTPSTDGIYHDTSHVPKHVKRDEEKSMYAYRGGNSIHKQHINGNVLSSTENVLAILPTFQDEFTPYTSSTEGATHTENLLNYLNNGDVGTISVNDDEDEKYENLTITNASVDLDVISVIPTNISFELRELEDISSGDYSTDVDIVSGSTESNNMSSVLSNIVQSAVSTESNLNDVLSVNGVANLTDPTWPVRHSAVVEGDLILGGLMMVHSREDTITCGPIMPQGGIQALEAMLFTIDRINEIGLLPNIKLGAHILDDCDKDTYGLEMAVDFIKGSISNIDGAEYHCNKTQVRKVISGVVGAASSVTSIQVANLLRLFRIPQVSFFSTSPELSNKQRFEYFSRTIPSDHYQVKAMVDIVRRMGWSYISIIYEESNYGIKAFEELEDLLAKHDICIAVKEKLVKDSGVAEEIAYDNIVQKLLTKPRARGAIIFGSDQEVREVMLAVRRNNATGAFSWIGSDGWSARNLVSDGNEPEVEGTLSVQPQANPVMGFEKHFLGLTVENNQRNPWFVEFWEDHFKCRYPNSSLTPYNKKYTVQCTTKEKLSKDATAFEDQLQFVSDAVMAFAYALSDMHKALCKGRPGLCDAMKPTKGADLLKYLRKVNFVGLSGDRFHFDSNGDGPARYNIIHFKQVSTGNYKWVKVGEYYEGELRLNMSEVQFKFHQPKPPESVCAEPCERGQAKKYVEGESCCWHCFNCTTYQIRHKTDETQCVTCRLGTLPDRMKEKCEDIPEQFLRPESGWAIGAMSFSSTGILITMFVVGVFLRHNETPVVRASGRELSYVLLAGILMCYSVTFALVLRPTDFSCGIQRFGAGFCFTVVYAALLTKTNRISRIFKHGKQSAKRPSFISPRSQLVICSGLTSIQLIINGIWMVISPAYAKHYYPTRDDNLLICDSYIDASYMIAFFYPILLIVVCTVYAVLTRKIPEAFNESKHIGFTMYTTCVIWLAFVPLYFGTANHVPLRITSMSVTISLSASVTLACLFSPKLYIILIRPERNVRQSMMPVRYSAINKTTGTGPSSMMAAIMVTAATCNQNEKIEKHVTPPAISNCESPSKKDENGSARFVEIATQTVTLTNLLTNYNKSLTNCNNIPLADDHQNAKLVPNNKSNNSSTNFIDNNNKFHNNPTATTSPAINNFNGQVGNANSTTNTTTADAVDNTIELRL